MKRAFVPYLGAAALAACLAFASSCDVLQKGAAGSFQAGDGPRTADQARDNLAATVECSPEIEAQNGERATPVGTDSFVQLPIRNGGSGNLVIDGAEIYLLDESGAVAANNQGIFSFSWGKPDFPLTIPPGGGVRLSFRFHPFAAGVFKADVLFKMAGGDRIVRLIGRGAYVVTLDVAAGSLGRIIRPIVVEEGDPPTTYLCVEPTLELEAETTDPVFLTELRDWTAASGFFEGTSHTSASLIATLHIEGPDTVTAAFDSPYLYVSTSGSDAGAGTAAGPFQTIGRAIAEFVATPGLKGIVVAFDGGAAHPITGADASLPPGLFRGGYSTLGTTQFDARPAGFASEFGAGPTASLITMTDASHLLYSGRDAAGNAVDHSASLLEGFRVVGGTYTPSAEPRNDDLSTGIAVLHGANPKIRACTFVGGPDPMNSVGAYVYDAQPTFVGCAFQGNDVSGQGGRSVGLWCDYLGAPIISGCLIRSGKSSGRYGKSYGVLNENFGASPLISGSDIFADTGAGASYAFWSSFGGRPELRGNQIHTANDGGENWGVFLYSNGRVYVLSGNNFYACGSGLVYFSRTEEAYDDIDEVNEEWVDGWDESAGIVDNTNVER